MGSNNNNNINNPNWNNQFHNPSNVYDQNSSGRGSRSTPLDRIDDYVDTHTIQQRSSMTPSSGGWAENAHNFSSSSQSNNFHNNNHLYNMNPGINMNAGTSNSTGMMSSSQQYTRSNPNPTPNPTQMNQMTNNYNQFQMRNSNLGMPQSEHYQQDNYLRGQHQQMNQQMNHQMNQQMNHQINHQINQQINSPQLDLKMNQHQLNQQMNFSINNMQQNNNMTFHQHHQNQHYHQQQPPGHDLRRQSRFPPSPQMGAQMVEVSPDRNFTQRSSTMPPHEFQFSPHRTLIPSSTRPPWREEIGRTISKGSSGSEEGEKQVVENPSIICRCVKSRCLKLYCDCFQAGILCNTLCKCIRCLNTESENKKGGRLKLAKRDYLLRKPGAFGKKPKKIGDGCACKNNRCLKKYCYCFRNQISCSIKCFCVSCANLGIHKRKSVADDL